MIGYQLRADRILSDRERKNISILNMLRKKGAIAKTDISRAISLNIVTVSNYVENYIAKGLVCEKGLAISTGGRRPLLIELNYNNQYVVGVGLSLTSISAVLINLGGKVIHSLIWDRPPQTGMNLVEEMRKITEKLFTQIDIPRERIVHIVLGMSGVLDQKARTIALWGPLEQQDIILDTAFVEEFEKKFSIKTSLENDADSAVFGEKWFMLDQSIRNVLYLYSGVGCGMIINGEIYHGATGNAGELGIDDKQAKTLEEWVNNSLKLGKWELDLGMIRQVRELWTKGHISPFIAEMTKNNQELMTPKIIIKAAAQKDPLVCNVLTNAVVHLGKKVAFLVNLLNPEVVFIGGGIEQAGEQFNDLLRDVVKKYTIPEISKDIKIVPAHLGEMGVALGAAAIGVEQIYMRA